MLNEPYCGGRIDKGDNKFKKIIKIIQKLKECIRVRN